MNVITNNNRKCIIALAGLQQVIDPEIGLSVVDLGLIYQLDFDEAAFKIYASMTLTTQFCPMGESIMHGVKQALQTRFPAEAIEVQLTFDPPWNHEMISTEGQIILNETTC